MIAAVIPTRFHPPTLDPLLEVLKQDGIPTFLYESEENGNNIHVMWNKGVAEAREIGATEIAILNDDISILPGTMELMAKVLRMDREAAVVIPEHHRPGSPYRLLTSLPVKSRPRIEPHNNVGYCFIIKAELPLPKFDERLFVHQGDIVFFDWVRKHNYHIVRAEGVRVLHLHSFSVNQTRHEGVQSRDAALYRELYPRENFEHERDRLCEPGHRASYDAARRRLRASLHRGGQAE